jgi:hypothetical protein
MHICPLCSREFANPWSMRICELRDTVRIMRRTKEA